MAERTIVLPAEAGQLRHIFRNDDGHLEDSAENRLLLLELVNDPDDLVGTDRFGNDWYVSVKPDGTQLWACTRGPVIRNGGRNVAVRNFGINTRLSKPTR